MSLAALLTDDPGGRLTAGRIAVHDDDLGAAFGEGECGGTADAVAGAGDQRDLAGKIQIHRVSLPLGSVFSDLPGPLFERDEQIADEPARGLVGEAAVGVELGLSL